MTAAWSCEEAFHAARTDPAGRQLPAGHLCPVLAFAVLVGFVFSYAVLKTGSIWTAAFLHGILNSLHAFFITYIVRPENKVLSFGLGIYGLALLAVVVLLLWRDPVWRGASP